VRLGHLGNAAPLRLALATALAIAAVAACEEQTPPANDEPPPPCRVDAECGAGRYCTEVGQCRRDCFVDVHCLGLGKAAQCNAQGRCIELVEPVPPPPPEAGPDADQDAPEEGTPDPPEGGAA
jgi:hypothetical protein